MSLFCYRNPALVEWLDVLDAAPTLLLLTPGAATEQARAGLPLDDTLAEQRWRTPLITTAYAHLEMAAATRLPHAGRLRLMTDAREIFRTRWLAWLIQEAEALQAAVPALVSELRRAAPLEVAWMTRSLSEALRGAATIVPEVAQCEAAAELASLCNQAAFAAA